MKQIILVTTINFNLKIIPQCPPAKIIIVYYLFLSATRFAFLHKTSFRIALEWEDVWTQIQTLNGMWWAAFIIMPSM
jgi:hypothetical protein